MKRFLLTVITVCVFVFPALGQANGKLQIHYGDVWQADSALLISPKGEVVLFDNGDSFACKSTMKYLADAKIKKIDYMIISHFHNDHFGCTPQVLTKYTTTVVYDRGEPFLPKTKKDKKTGKLKITPFGRYMDALADTDTERKAVTTSMTIVLDKGSDHPVRINIVAFNGAGVPGATNENDRSVAAVIHFGEFDVMMAGDLSGDNDGGYKDVETPVSKRVGQVEVYKVNHHGSQYSSNNRWMAKLNPRIAIISAGNGNKHGHPTTEALDRIHAANVAKTYWTELGKGATPKAGKDVVVFGTIKIEVAPGASKFTVMYGEDQTDTYSVWPDPYKP